MFSDAYNETKIELEEQEDLNVDTLAKEIRSYLTQTLYRVPGVRRLVMGTQQVARRVTVAASRRRMSSTMEPLAKLAASAARVRAAIAHSAPTEDTKAGAGGVGAETGRKDRSDTVGSDAADGAATPVTHVFGAPGDADAAVSGQQADAILTPGASPRRSLTRIPASAAPTSVAANEPLTAPVIAVARKTPTATSAEGGADAGPPPSYGAGHGNADAGSVPRRSVAAGGSHVARDNFALLEARLSAMEAQQATILEILRSLAAERLSVTTS